MSQMFCNGDRLYQAFADRFRTHKRGLFIVAPSGSGKTHYVHHQTEPDWIDGDELWTVAGAHPDRAWWTEGIEVINDIDQKSDIITSEAKKLGFWVIGASNFWLIPDAMVIPDWRTHKKFIAHREQRNYDGGATTKDFDQVLGHREWLLARAKKEKIPVYKSITEAINKLRDKYQM